VRIGTALTLAAGIALAAAAAALAPTVFVPGHRIPGVGVERKELDDELLELRTQRMIQAQTFGILREGGALAGARRIVDSPRLQSLFQAASGRSGIPRDLLEAIAYLESFGDPAAQSPAGPRGIMQISVPTAHDMGLAVVVATRYRIAKERVAVTKAGHTRFKTVTHRTAYTAMVRDDRLVPERAIPAAAMYLANLERKFGGRDWAIFAYHCGAGCVSEMIGLTRKARGVPADQVTVPRMFFSATPGWNRELYSAIEAQMLRDYSPTYYFRIMRVQELLALYRSDPKAFAAMFAEYRANYSTTARAPHRLALWLTPKDLVFRSPADIQADAGQRLAPAPDRSGLPRLHPAVDLRRRGGGHSRGAGHARIPGLRNPPALRIDGARRRFVPPARGHLAGGTRGRGPSGGRRRSVGTQVGRSLRYLPSGIFPPASWNACGSSSTISVGTATSAFSKKAAIACTSAAPPPPAISSPAYFRKRGSRPWRRPSSLRRLWGRLVTCGPIVNRSSRAPTAPCDPPKEATRDTAYAQIAQRCRAPSVCLT
jgi:hypothetical protein